MWGISLNCQMGNGLNPLKRVIGILMEWVKQFTNYPDIGLNPLKRVIGILIIFGVRALSRKAKKSQSPKAGHRYSDGGG